MPTEPIIVFRDRRQAGLELAARVAERSGSVGPKPIALAAPAAAEVQP